MYCPTRYLEPVFSSLIVSNNLFFKYKTQVVVDQLWSDEEEVTSVGPGENVKIKLKGVEEEDISSGFVLCDPNNTCKTGRIFDAQVNGFISYV